MAQRLPVSMSGVPKSNTRSLAPGELGRAKDAWADEGCQVPDEAEDRIRRFEHDVREGVYSTEELAEVARRVNGSLESGAITDEIGKRILAIINSAESTDAA